MVSETVLYPDSIKNKEENMNFLKIEDEMNFHQKMFVLKREIESFLFEEGYMNIEPSIFEDYDEFTGVNFRIDKGATVKLLESNGSISILTPDITTGIVNKFMNRWEPDLKLKLFYYGKTYMHTGYGIKEKRQMGVELIGEKDENTDENILKTAISIISRYSSNYIFEIGNSKFLKGIMQACSFSKEDNEKILNILYSKNKQELKVFLEGLSYKEPMSTLINILDMEGSFEEITGQLEGLYMNDLMVQGLNELRRINSYFRDKGNIIYDLSMVSELSYYDGILFKGYVYGSNKEIIKGGRYDSFTEQYGRKIPAIGFSVELDELIKTLYKEEMQ